MPYSVPPPPPPVVEQQPFEAFRATPPQSVPIAATTGSDASDFASSTAVAPPERINPPESRPAIGSLDPLAQAETLGAPLEIQLPESPEPVSPPREPVSPARPPSRSPDIPAQGSGTPDLTDAPPRFGVLPVEQIPELRALADQIARPQPDRAVAAAATARVDTDPERISPDRSSASPTELPAPWAGADMTDASDRADRSDVAALEPGAIEIPVQPPASSAPSAALSVASTPEAAPPPQPSPRIEPAPVFPTTPIDPLNPIPVLPPAPPLSPVPGSSAPAPNGPVLTIPTPETAPGAAPLPPTSPDGTPAPVQQFEVEEVVELSADRQEYDVFNRVFTATGNVSMRFRQATLTADRLRVNLPNRIAVAEGNVALTRGRQILFGDRFVYNFVQEEGTITAARGEVFVPSLATDTNPPLPNDLAGNAAIPGLPTSQQVTNLQPVTEATASGSQLTFGAGSDRLNPFDQGVTGAVNRLRFEAEQLDFSGANWVGTNVRITNDPFSPPELELRSRRVEFNQIDEFRSEIRASNPRVVFDQGLSLPLFINRYVIDNRQRDPGLISVGFDEDERGGLFLQRTFNFTPSPFINFSVTPQYYIQRSFDQNNFLAASSFGVEADFNAIVSPSTTLSADVSLTSLDGQDLEDNLRARVRARQALPYDHTLTLEYTYRNRVFNGSLGLRNVQSSIGAVLTSPVFVLGDSQINLSYQASLQYFNAESDQGRLFDQNLADRDVGCLRDESSRNNRGCVDLTRFQGNVALSRIFYLWQGTPLPATPDQGLRYSPVPLAPYLGIYTGITGTTNFYSSGDTQANVNGSIALFGQFGHFSRPVFDYTAFFVSYSQGTRNGNSPYLFDRASDFRVLAAGITQQIYGPLRAGVQTTYNLDTGNNIDTIFSLEYSRRTYGILLNYSPVREAAALSLRVSDFNWSGDPGPFSGLGAPSVVYGVERSNN